MNLIVDFYRGLDTLNLILFWGIIIVIILLLTFSIIIANKNKKLNQMLREKKEENNQTNEEESIPIKEKTEPVIQEPIKETIIEEPIVNTSPVEEIEEKKFVAEEHVIEYNKDLFSLPNIKKAPENPEIKEPPKKEPIKEVIIPKKPYERNVLRELSLNQTSPIGIIKKEQPIEKNIEKAEDLNKSLNIEELEIKKNNFPEEPTEPVEVPKRSSRTYLAEVSKKISESSKNDEIDRTAYELQQEEEAIISYEELMQKKDQIKMVDEEDAVISIEELVDRVNNKDKLYYLTEEEGNDKFIDELKNFRHDL